MGNGSDLVAAVRDRYGDIGTRHTNKVATQYRRAAVALAAVVELLERDAS